MFTKIAVLAAAGAGYVLGARAGRGRYEQMSARAHELAERPDVQHAAAAAKETVAAAAASAAVVAKDKAVSAKDKAGSVASRAAKDDAPDLPSAASAAPAPGARAGRSRSGPGKASG